MSSEPTRRELRHRFRAARRVAAAARGTPASSAVTSRLLDLPEVDAARRFAAYLADDGEIDPAEMIRAWWDRACEVYLPVVIDRAPMRFGRYRPDTELSPNRLGILEPPLDEVVGPTELDIVVTPLVAFDEAGGRLGRGGGYYDRTFVHRLDRSTTRPLLVGVAHECQRADHLPSAPHDVPLDVVITDEATRRASTSVSKR